MLDFQVLFISLHSSTHFLALFIRLVISYSVLSLILCTLLLVIASIGLILLCIYFVLFFSSTSRTLPFETRSNISKIAISPDGGFIVCIDMDGYGIFASLVSNAVLCFYNFRAPVDTIAFSPDGNFFAVGLQQKLKVFESPVRMKVFAPLKLYKKYTTYHADSIVKIAWSSDSRFLLTCCKDRNVRIFSLHKIKGFIPFTLAGHKATPILGAFTSQYGHVFSLAKDGYMNIWKWIAETSEGHRKQQEFSLHRRGKKLKVVETQSEGEEDKELYTNFEKEVTEGRFILEKKQKYELSGARIKCAELNEKAKILVIGLNNGQFSLYSIVTFEPIHSFKISEKEITGLDINRSGEWIALAAESTGMLCVWEWKSETYVLKQQGHHYEINVVAYSPNGSVIASGGDDGKVKVWDARTSFCFITFKEHTSTITGLCFLPITGNAVISSSLDGTVRAFDLIRYKNFRIMTATTSVQFTCVTITRAGDIVCAGSMDPFNVYLWTLKTGELIDVLSGHSAPISGVLFSEPDDKLITSSWDSFIRLWNIYSKRDQVEILDHDSEVVAIALAPDCKRLYAATLSGKIYIWLTEDAHLFGTIECQRDILGGRLANDKVAAKNLIRNKHFTSICLNPTGEYILACGNTKYACLYDAKHKLLLRRYTLTNNRSLDGTLIKLNSKSVGEFGVREESEFVSGDSEEETLPGARKPATVKRRTKLAIRGKAIRMAMDGQSFACVTTEGIALYSLNDGNKFAPYNLSIDVTLNSAIEAYNSGNYIESLIVFSILIQIGST